MHPFLPQACPGAAWGPEAISTEEVQLAQHTPSAKTSESAFQFQQFLLQEPSSDDLLWLSFLCSLTSVFQNWNLAFSRWHLGSAKWTVPTTILRLAISFGLALSSDCLCSQPSASQLDLNSIVVSTYRSALYIGSTGEKLTDSLKHQSDRWVHITPFLQMKKLKR